MHEDMGTKTSSGDSWVICNVTSSIWTSDDAPLSTPNENKVANYPNFI